MAERLHTSYSGVPWLQRIRESNLVSESASRLITEFRRVRGRHPYPDILSNDTPGWKLMRAILEQFIQELAPLPVVIFPVPTRDFYEVGMQPVYQALFDSLDDPARGVHIGDISSELISRPYNERKGFTHRVGGHLTWNRTKIRTTCFRLSANRDRTCQPSPTSIIQPEFRPFTARFMRSFTNWFDNSKRRPVVGWWSIRHSMFAANRLSARPMTHTDVSCGRRMYT